MDASVFWVVERGISHPDRPEFLTLVGGYMWTHEIELAMRFSRQRDAANYVSAHLSWRPCRIVSRTEGG